MGRPRLLFLVAIAVVELCASLWGSGKAEGVPSGTAASVGISVSPLEFGEIVRAGVYASMATIVVHAPEGVSLRLAIDGGLYHVAGGIRSVRRAGGPETLRYELYQDSGRARAWGDADFGNTYPRGSSLPAAGTGREEQLMVYAELFVDDLPPPGTYQDAVTVTAYY